jgi:hypothetical protein
MSKQRKPSASTGRPSKLTAEIIKQLTEKWGLAGENTLSDAEVARALGVSPKTLEGWLANDVRGLSGVRTRARSGIKIFYLSQLNLIGQRAVALEDFRTASSVYRFLLERQYPREYGRFLRVSESTSRDWLETATEDEIDAFVEENRQLLETKQKPERPVDHNV